MQNKCKVPGARPVLIHLLCTLTFALLTFESRPVAQVPAAVVLYEGARFIAGDGSAPIPDSAFLVENGTITKVGRKGELTAPAGAGRVNLSGKTVMPALDQRARAPRLPAGPHLQRGQLHPRKHHRRSQSRAVLRGGGRPVAGH